MNAPGSMCFEDFTVGYRIATEPVTLDEAEMIDYARRYDPQPFHIDPEAARDSAYGGLIASGFQTVAIATGQFLRSRVLDGCGLGGPGMQEVRWLVPVRAGDTLETVIEVGEVRPSRSLPDRGIVRFEFTSSVADEQVMTFAAIVFVRRRNPGEKS